MSIGNRITSYIGVARKQSGGTSIAVFRNRLDIFYTFAAAETYELPLAVSRRQIVSLGHNYRLINPFYLQLIQVSPVGIAKGMVENSSVD